MLSLAIKSGRGCTVPNYLVITASSNFEDAAQIDRGEPQVDRLQHWAEVPKMTREEKRRYSKVSYALSVLAAYCAITF